MNRVSGMNGDGDRINGFRRWTGLALISFIFLTATGGAFSSLGVILPAMIAEFDWSWTQGGAGFTVLGLMTGLSSLFPAQVIRRSNLRVCLLIGGAVVAAGFCGLGVINSFWGYVFATAIVGCGYSLVGAVPGVRALSSWFDRKRSLAISIFFTSGAVGSIIGPFAASVFVNELGDWRLYWIVVGLVCFGLSVIAFLTIPDTEVNTTQEAPGAKVDSGQHAEVSWTLQQVMRNPQFYVIVIAVTVTLLGALTMNSWQVTHMQKMGVAAHVAAGALSMHAIFNAASRALGGLVIDRIGAQWVLASGLGAGVIGMSALSVADTPLLILLFALGDGYSFGIVTFASAILLLKYYGLEHNPSILGMLNFMTTAAMVGPIFAGSAAENFGGFTIVFIVIAGIMFISMVSVCLMTAPVLPKTAGQTDIPIPAGGAHGQSATTPTPASQSRAPQIEEHKNP